MWLFTRYGFYSIACASPKDGSLNHNFVMIRARRVDHLRRLQGRFAALAGADIVTLAHRDYRYRLIVSQELWAGIVSEQASEPEWSNFKNEVARYQGPAGSDYVHALHNVWGVMHELQDSEVRPQAPGMRR